MSTDILVRCPQPTHLPKAETGSLVLGLILSHQGGMPEQWSRLLEQLRDARRELEIRHIEWVPPAQWPAEIEHAT